MTTTPLNGPTNKRLRRGASAALIIISMTASGAAHAQPSEAPSDPVKVLFEEGLQALRDGDYSEAERLLQQAFDQRRSADVAGNLGYAELELGDYVQAAEHLTYALDYLPALADPETAALLREHLDTASGKVATWVIARTPADAEVSVDGVPVALDGGDRVFVAPGQRVLSASAPGHEPYEETRVATAGGTEDIVVELLPSTTATPDGPPPITPPGDRPLWPSLALGGVSLVGVGMGIGFLAARTSNFDDAEGQPCPDGTCPEAQDSLDTANAMGTLSIVSFGVAGAALIGAVVLWPWGGGSEASVQSPKSMVGTTNPGVVFLPAIGPEFQGLSVSGAF